MVNSTPASHRSATPSSYHHPDLRVPRGNSCKWRQKENVYQPVAEAASLRSRFCNSLALQNRARQQAVRMHFYHRLLCINQRS